MTTPPCLAYFPFFIVFQERLKAACKPTVHEMMFFMNAWALLLVSVAAHLSGQGVEGFYFCVNNPTVMASALTPLFQIVPTRYPYAANTPVVDHRHVCR